MRVKHNASTVLTLVCDLVKERKEDFKSFLEFFHLVHNSCQSHNGLIRSRLRWRQWAGSGLMQYLWFGSRLCRVWSAEKSACFDCHSAFFLCVTHQSLLDFLEERVTAGLCCVPPCVYFTFCATKRTWSFFVVQKKQLWFDQPLLSATFLDWTEALSFAHN